MSVANSPHWQQIQECYRVLQRAKSNVVHEILRQSPPFVEWDHYPKGDVFDRLTRSQYFYHAHPAAVPDNNRLENGHFHLFMREKKGEALCHLIAISMDRYGYPIALFTTNRWVTGETWRVGDEVVALLPQFNIDHSFPSWPLNLWLSAMVQFYVPEITALIRERDRVIRAWQEAHPHQDVFEDRALEVTSIRLIRTDANDSPSPERLK